jgi:hypothetical protein
MIDWGKAGHGWRRTTFHVGAHGDLIERKWITSHLFTIVSGTDEFFDTAPTGRRFKFKLVSADQEQVTCDVTPADDRRFTVKVPEGIVNRLNIAVQDS